MSKFNAEAADWSFYMSLHLFGTGGVACRVCTFARPLILQLPFPRRQRPTKTKGYNSDVVVGLIMLYCRI